MRANQFLANAHSHDSHTWNGAVSHASSGCSVLDYFSKAGSYRNRQLQEVAADMAAIFGQDEMKAMKTVLYNRTVTRKPVGFGGSITDEPQRGQGVKDEFVKSLAWLESNRADLFSKNLWLVPLLGSWSDLWYDSPSTGYFHYSNPSLVFPLVADAIQNSEYHRAMVAKHLPKIRSRSNTKTQRHVRLNNWARQFCNYMGWSERDYRKFKSNPENKAHDFQRVMCDGKWNQLDFNKISGKALFNLVARKGKDKQNAIERHGLTNKYISWIKSKPVAKFTGYVYEIYKKVREKGYRGNVSEMEKHTFDAQFNQLLELAKENVNPDLLENGVLCALDTSGSMGSQVDNHGTTALDVCVSLGIFFSSLLKGHFHNHVIAYSDQSKFFRFSGESFCDKVQQVDKAGWWMGGTNFQSVIDEIVRLRRSKPHIPVRDYPKVLLVVSDMQFNPVAGASMWDSYRGRNLAKDTQTNYEAAMQKLRAVGLPDMTIIWWHVNGRFTKDSPVKMDDAGTVLISGFDASIVTTILGGTEEVYDPTTGQKRKLTPEEQMDRALDQQLLNMIEV